MARMFEWNEIKNQTTVDDRDISFETAKQIWDDPNRWIFEKKKKEGEDRWALVGMIGGIHHTVVYTIRGESTYRIISVRRSKPSEESGYIRNRDRYMLESHMSKSNKTEDEDIFKEYKPIKKKPKFKDEYLMGKVSFDDIESYVSNWKQDHKGEILQDYLGLDDEEFKAYKSGNLKEKWEKENFKPTGSLLLRALARIVKDRV